MGSVDVFVPCYGYAHFLRDSVGSILDQSIRDLRVLIIDDASPDHTAEVAAELCREDPRVEYVRHETNLGHIATYNEGIEWASADYMLLLSADDIVLPGALDRAAALMDAHPEVSLTYGRSIWFQHELPVPRLLDSEASLHSPYAGRGGKLNLFQFERLNEGHIDVSPKRYEIMDGVQFIARNRHANQVHTVTAVVRTETQKRVGQYKAELPHAGDMEMWFRFAVHGKIGFLHAYQGATRLHGKNMSTHQFGEAMADLQQRRLLMDSFFSEHGHRVANCNWLRSQMYRGLAEAALRKASGRLSVGDKSGFGELRLFAEDVCPSIRRSSLWPLLTCKQYIGPEAWSLLRPFMTTITDRLFALR